MTEENSATQQQPAKVAIIGGGCAAMTAAFDLTSPDQKGKFDVTVYQLGWRLGGKGASGRAQADRIEEHGLHIWLGFYENAFEIMRECYEELGRDPRTCRFSDWRDVFVPDPIVGVADRSAEGEWQRWMAFFPAEPGEPGDGRSAEEAFSVAAYMTRTVSLLGILLDAVQERAVASGGEPAAATADGSSATPGSSVADGLMQTVTRILRLGPLVSVAGLIEAVRVLETVLGAAAPLPNKLVLRLLDSVASGMRDVVEGTVAGDNELRRLWEIIDLTLAILRGCVRFGLATDPRGFDAIDQYELREWLMMNGASRRSVDSAVVRGLYDLALAYEKGDAARPGLAAGQAIRGAMRMFFTYRGALFWKMQTGMGDAIFAPMYEVLRARGVKFEFFHRLENMKLAAADSLRAGEAPYIEALEFDVQAEPKKAGYDPLIDVRGLPCWPAEPRWEHLRNGGKLRDEGREFESHWDQRKVGKKVLRVTDDFDFAVLAVGGGAVRHLCAELIEREPRWRTMVDNINTVATQALQLWMREDMEQLGWNGLPPNISAFQKPFDTWADMRHLIPEESGSDELRAIAYFCGVLPCDDEAPSRDMADHPVQQQQLVYDGAMEYLERHVAELWPGARRPDGGFRWNVLIDDAGGDGDGAGAGDEADATRLQSQYWTANVNPTDRYVLALPGTIEHRISPLDNTFDNLTIAGDWTDSGFNEGCVEAAVMSGRLAAHALSGYPRLEDIVGYDHP